MRFTENANIALSTKWQPQRAYMWEIELPVIANSIMSGTTPSDISERCLGIKFGLAQLTSVREKRFGNRIAKYPGLQSIENATLTFLEVEDGSTLGYLKAWYDLMVNDKGYNVRSLYAKTIHCTLFKTNQESSMSFKLRNCYPTRLPSFDLNYNASGIVTYDIPFSVDYDKGTFSDLAQSASSAAGLIPGSDSVSSFF